MFMNLSYRTYIDFIRPRLSNTPIQLWSVLIGTRISLSRLVVGKLTIPCVLETHRKHATHFAAGMHLY